MKGTVIALYCLLGAINGEVLYDSPRAVYSQAQHCSVQYTSYLREFTALYRSGGPCAQWYPFFDCCHLTRLFPVTSSGVYEIGDPCVHSSLNPYNSRLHAKCDMFAAGGGWTVIMQRNTYNGTRSGDFSSRAWDEYEDGFGSFSGDFWFGLANLRCITQRETYELRVELTLEDGTEGEIIYSSFGIDYRSNHYSLSIGTPSDNSTASNALKALDGYNFQTADYASNSNCKRSADGGFWLPNSGSCSPRTNLHAATPIWSRKSVTAVKMMIRPVSCALIRDCAA